MKEVDARGLSCPEPVLLAKAAVEAGDFPVTVLVDDAAPFENVQRFAVNAGYQVSTAEIDGGHKITIQK